MGMGVNSFYLFQYIPLPILTSFEKTNQIYDQRKVQFLQVFWELLMVRIQIYFYYELTKNLL